MTSRKMSKKTDKIEVRLSPETKQAFHETCEQQGESASSVIRHLIEGYVARFHQPVLERTVEIVRGTPGWIRIVVASVTAIIGTAAILLPSSAESPWQHQFNYLDVNGDGQLNLDEYVSRMTVGEGESDPSLRSYLESEFSEMDADKDERVSSSEYSNGQTSQFEDLFGELNSDGDSRISFLEFTRPNSIDARSAIAGMASGTAYRQGGDLQDFDPVEDVKWMMGLTEDLPPYAARIGQVFRDFDQDDNGYVDRAEFLKRGR